MCGRFTQTTGELPGLVTTTLDEAEQTHPPRYNGAPGQDHWVIRRHPETGQNIRDRLIWGFKSPWMAKKGLAAQIIARAEGVATSGMFKASYAERRCIVPVDSFFEWRKTKGPGPKQPYAVGLVSGEPFGIAAIWTGYQSGEGQWVHNFAVITCAPNELLETIHDRMPVILQPDGYERWLANIEPDPADLMVPYPAELMRMWPISTRVNSTKNDVPDILDPVD